MKKIKEMSNMRKLLEKSFILFGIMLAFNSFGQRTGILKDLSYSVDISQSVVLNDGINFRNVDDVTLVEVNSSKLSKEEEAFSLKCLIHLVGDIHQPMHVGNGKDRGGNDVKVTYFWKSSNLHRVWDTGIIDGQNLSFTEYVSWIDNAPKMQIDKWKNDDIMVWAKESMSYRSQIYDLPESKKINYRYNYDNISTVNIRLLQAGIRLAAVLEDIYG